MSDTSDNTLVERLPQRLLALHEHLKHQPLTHVDQQDMATILAAATALDTCRNEVADRDAKIAELLRERSETQQSLKTAELAFANSQLECSLLSQKLERATEALEPFATEADQWEGFSDDENLVEMWNGGPATNLTVAHLREARTARAFLNSSSKDEGLQTGASQNG